MSVTGEGSALVDCRILGPVEIGNGHRVLALGSTKEARLLAALAFDVGRPVGLDTLIHRLWDDDPPRHPLGSLYANTARLRRHMAEVQAGDGPGPTIHRQSHTYLFDAAPEDVDWHRFEGLTARAAALADDAEDQGALELYQQADLLWRGQPLGGLSGLWPESLRSILSGKRLRATVARIAVELRLSRFTEVIGELTELVAAHPTNEVLVGQLMIASHGRGLHADALRLYANLRHRLREELGSDPGPALARTHELILAHAPVSALIPAHRKITPVGRTPHVLPRHARLVGREQEMRALMSRVGTATGTGAVIALQSISGMAGVGKSLLAWSAAERLADRFPEGLLHLDLRAHALTREPMTPQAALTHLIRTLGTPPQGMPETLEELTAQWRTTMQGRRMVVVLDDASGPEQVRPLLPGNSPSLVLITSRRRLSGLPGVRPLVLDVLPPPDAVALFHRMVEDDRADDPEEVARIVSLCGYLPLAVEIAASRLNSRPGWSLAYLIERLSREHARIEELHDTDREIASAFYVSYATLTAQERSVFRQLSLHLMPNFGPHSASAVTGLPLHRVERAIDALVDAHLLQAPTQERYRYHDLLGEFALGLESAEGSAEEHDSAMRRLIDFYIRAVDAADRLIRPERNRLALPRLPGPPVPADTSPPWQDAAEAERWLMGEHLGLTNAAQYARTHDMPDRAAVLSRVMAGFLEAGGFWSDAEHMHRHAVHHWYATGDRAAELRAHIDLGTLYTSSGRYEEAAGSLGTAVTIAAESGDTAAELETLLQLGTLSWHQGRLDSALAIQHEVLSLSERTGDRRRTAATLNNIGITSLYLGRYAIAEIVLRESLREFQAVDDRLRERRVRNNLADLYLRRGNKHAARESLREAQQIKLPNANRADLAVLNITLGSALDIPEHLDEALGLFREALEISRELGDLRNQVICLNEMGTAYRAAGRPADAVGPHTSALNLARTIGAVMEEVQSLLALGTTEQRMGRHRAAITHLEAAQELARQLGLPLETAEAATELARARSAAKHRESA